MPILDFDPKEINFYDSPTTIALNINKWFKAIVNDVCGTIYSKDTGTAAGTVPENSHVGELKEGAYFNVGNSVGQVITNIQDDDIGNSHDRGVLSNVNIDDQNKRDIINMGFMRKAQLYSASIVFNSNSTITQYGETSAPSSMRQISINSGNNINYNLLKFFLDVRLVPLGGDPQVYYQNVFMLPVSVIPTGAAIRIHTNNSNTSNETFLWIRRSNGNIYVARGGHARYSFRMRRIVGYKY